MKVLVVGTGAEHRAEMAHHIALALSAPVEVVQLEEPAPKEVMRLEASPELEIITPIAERKLSEEDFNRAVPMPKPHRKYRV